MDNKILTNIKPIDEVPMEKGELVLLMGRPAIGKTTLVLKMILNLIEEKKYTTLFSIEMGQWQVLLRMVELDSRVKFINVNKDNLTSFECEQIGRSLTKIISHETPKSDFLEIMDSYNLSDDAVDEHLVFISDFIEKKQDVVIIDYLQLMELFNCDNYIDKNLSENKKRTLEQELILKHLKEIAVKHNVLIVVIAQMSRIFLREDITLENLTKYQYKNICEVCDKVIIVDSNENQKDYKLLKENEKKNIVTVYDKNGQESSAVYKYNEFDD